MTIRVLLADDQALLVATFRILIDSEPDLTVVAEAANGREAVDLALVHAPDVVLMDIRRPGTDGLAATADICARPELSAGLKTKDNVRFRFREAGDEYVIEQIEKAGGEK